MRNLQFADVTLRMTGARPEGAPSFKEKIEIAKLLDRLAVPVIETPPITDAQVDALVIKTIANLAETAAVSVPVGLSEEGVARAWEAVKGAKHPRLQVIVPTSPVQMEYGCHKKPPMVLEMIAALVTACRARCAEVEFVADDATRAEPAFLRQAIAAAAAAGASVITLCDAAGDQPAGGVCRLLLRCPGRGARGRRLRLGGAVQRRAEDGPRLRGGRHPRRGGRGEGHRGRRRLPGAGRPVPDRPLPGGRLRGLLRPAGHRTAAGGLPDPLDDRARPQRQLPL